MNITDLDLGTIELEPDGEVLRVWLNRPASRNAHNQQMIEEVGDLFIALNAIGDFRVVVLGGRGKSFCAGADRKEQAVSSPNARVARYVGQLGRRAARAIEDCDAVTVARVHGHAIGGGCCFGTSCDFRVTTADALWYVPEVELGVPLPWGATPRLIHEIGAARARQMILTCERVDGRRAADWGLAHEVVDDESQLDAAVQRWVDRLLDMPPLSSHMAKYQLRGYSQVSRLGDLSEFDGDASAIASRSDDARGRFGTFG
jgi:enoyl-CoA hydratase/carnithine racemase